MSMLNKVEFNAQVLVSEQLIRQMVNTRQDVAMRCVKILGEKFNFDADEEIRLLGLNMMKLERKQANGEKIKNVKMPKIAVAKSAFPLPFNGEFNDTYCYALRQNSGLYTQCTGIRKGSSQFCKSCASQMQKVGAETPEYGTIQQRLAVGLFDYVDPKGRKPVPYAKIMKKHKITEDQVLAEASKFNITINPEHFKALEESRRGRPSTKKDKAPKKKGQKGRPKKSKKVLMIEGEDDDLFAALVAEANEGNSDLLTSNKKKGKSDEEKEAERLQKEAEKAEKEAKRLAEKEAKKKAEEEARLAKEAAKEAEKKAKKEAAELAKKEKEAAKEAEKKAKKEAAELAKKEKEAAELAKKAAKINSKDADVEASEDEDEDEDEEDEEQEIVQKIQYEGKKYLKSNKSGIIYDYNKYVKESEQVVVGKWSETDNKIIFIDDEESEEEYEL